MKKLICFLYFISSSFVFSNSMYIQTGSSSVECYIQKVPDIRVLQDAETTKLLNINSEELLASNRLIEFLKKEVCFYKVHITNNSANSIYARSYNCLKILNNSQDISDEYLVRDFLKIFPKSTLCNILKEDGSSCLICLSTTIIVPVVFLALSFIPISTDNGWSFFCRLFSGMCAGFGFILSSCLSYTPISFLCKQKKIDKKFKNFIENKEKLEIEPNIQSCALVCVKKEQESTFDLRCNQNKVFLDFSRLESSPTILNSNFATERTPLLFHI